MEKSESAMEEVRDRIKKLQMDNAQYGRFLELRQAILWHANKGEDFLEALIQQRQHEWSIDNVELP